MNFGREIFFNHVALRLFGFAWETGRCSPLTSGHASCFHELCVIGLNAREGKFVIQHQCPFLPCNFLLKFMPPLCAAFASSRRPCAPARRRADPQRRGHASQPVRRLTGARIPPTFRGQPAGLWFVGGLKGLGCRSSISGSASSPGSEIRQAGCELRWQNREIQGRRRAGPRRRGRARAVGGSRRCRTGIKAALADAGRACGREGRRRPVDDGSAATRRGPGAARCAATTTS